MFDLGPNDNGVTDVNIGYVGGGSQGWAHQLIRELARCGDVSGEVRLYDVDHERAAENATLGNRVMDRPDVDGAWRFDAVSDLGPALADADFVFCSIQDPPAETFRHDLDIPLEYGIIQTVGDTVGPGGILRGMRAIPQFRDIAAAVREHCPNAWVLNFTNPMTVCTRTLYAEYPDINAIGLCHEVFKSQELLADLAERHIDAATDVSRDDIAITVNGINHFTWVDEATWRDRDVFQYLDRELAERGPLPRHEPGDLDDEPYMTNYGDVMLDLYDRYGVLGAAGDRHLVEFVPWYLGSIDDPAEIQRWGTRCTPSSYRTSDAYRPTGAEGPSLTAQYLNGEQTFEVTDTGEEFLDIVRALLGIEPIVTNLNAPNIGQTPDLTDGAVVETNALLSGDSVSPVTAGSLPRPVRTLVQRHADNQETLVEAGMAGDVDLAFQAFCNDPLVSIAPDRSRELFQDLVEAEEPYLTAWNLSEAAVLRTAALG